MSRRNVMVSGKPNLVAANNAVVRLCWHTPLPVNDMEFYDNFLCHSFPYIFTKEVFAVCTNHLPDYKPLAEKEMK